MENVYPNIARLEQSFRSRSLVQIPHSGRYANLNHGWVETLWDTNKIYQDGCGWIRELLRYLNDRIPDHLYYRYTEWLIAILKSDGLDIGKGMMMDWALKSMLPNARRLRSLIRETRRAIKLNSGRVELRDYCKTIAQENGELFWGLPVLIDFLDPKLVSPFWPALNHLEHWHGFDGGEYKFDGGGFAHRLAGFWFSTSDRSGKIGLNKF